MSLGVITLLGLLATPGQLPPDVVAFNQAKMEIPIRYEPSLKNEIQHLLLFVSRGEGKGWQQYATATPDKDQFFPFTAPEDGVYWFTMVIVDKQGRREPADVYKVAPGLKVLIDTKSPLIQIRSVERVGDEVQVSWEIQEANPDWTKFRVDYRLGDGSWTPIEARGAAVGQARFRMANFSGPISVRVQAYDLAGNRSELSKDLAAPSNVLNTVQSGQGSGINQTAARMNFPGDLPNPMYTGGGGIALPGAPHEGVPLKGLPDTNVPKSPTTGPGSPLPIDPLPPARSEIPTGAVANQTTNLPAAQVINVSKFDIAYEVENRGPSGIGKTEVWITRDDGKSWQKWDVTEKGESPITIDINKRGNQSLEGIYGIRLVLQSGAGLSKGPPVSGDAPDMRIDVDLTPPAVKIYEPIPDPNQKDTMILRWQAVDRNLANDPITLEWSEAQDGPWHPIVGNDVGAATISTNNTAARRLPNTGQYAWKLPANFPTHKVYLRVTARDTAGNVAEHKTLQPILVDLNKPVARIQGIIGASTSEKR